MLKKILAILALLYASATFAAVEVNRATAADLDAIKGIGPVMSKRILDERKKGGEFKSWEDFINRVSGVGEGNAALTRYAPDAIFRANVLIGYRQSIYPADNFFPATINAVGFVDADGAVPASEFWRLADVLAHDAGTFDVLCGSRVKMAGRSVERSLFRHLQGRTFATIVEEMFQLGFYDTQCGMKFFRGSMVADILDALAENRWLLDIEVLSLLKARGARCVEAPIDCHERGGSALVFGIDPLRMVAGLWRLKRRLARRTAAQPVEVAR